MFARNVFSLPTYCSNTHKIGALKFGDFVDLDNKFVDINTITLRTGIELNQNDYWRIRPFIEQNISTNIAKIDHEHTPIDIFLANFKEILRI